MKLLTILLCVLGGVILFLPRTPIPSAYQYPLLFLLLFVCSLIRAVQAYRQGAATGSTYTKVAAVLTPVFVVVCIILFKLRYL